jgi:hypothetical protein
MYMYIYTNTYINRQLRVLQTEKEGVEAEVGDLKKQLDSMKVEREKVCVYVGLRSCYLHITECLILYMLNCMKEFEFIYIFRFICNDEYEGIQLL